MMIKHVLIVSVVLISLGCSPYEGRRIQAEHRAMVAAEKAAVRKAEAMYQAEVALAILEDADARKVAAEQQFESEGLAEPEDQVKDNQQQEEEAQSASTHPVPESPLWLTYPGGEGPGAGKHIVFIAADQEYRSEQSLPMLSRTLSAKYGFHCTVLFSVNGDGHADPTMKIKWEDETATHNIPGLEHMASADLVILFSRLITLPDEQLQHFYTYLDSGKPLIGLRTANHGFLGFDYEVDGERVRFGDDILGGAFRSHHGRWHADSTRGIIVEENASHPILSGVSDVWGPSDVYRTYDEDKELPAGCTPLLFGQPLMGRSHDDEVNEELIALPVAWTKTWTGNGGKTARVFHSTMGSARDFQSAGLRRLLFNAAFWCMGMEAEIDPTSTVEIQGEYEPLLSGFNYEKLGVVAHPPAFYR